MGWTSEMVAKDFQVSREKQDQYALISHQRAEKVNSRMPFTCLIALLRHKLGTESRYLQRRDHSNRVAWAED